jgi:hypothetical protein
MCSCTLCSRGKTVLGCKRKSISSINSLKYCKIESTSSSTPILNTSNNIMKDSQGCVPILVTLDKMIWRVSYKSILFPLPNNSSSFTTTINPIEIDDIITDSNLLLNSNPFYSGKNAAILKLNDQWVHLDLCQQTLNHIIDYSKNFHQPRGKFTGYSGFIFVCSSSEKMNHHNHIRYKQLLAVVMGKIPITSSSMASSSNCYYYYEILIQVTRPSLYVI